MNIFILDDEIQNSVKYLDDLRVVKMVLESVQMLSTVSQGQLGIIEGLYKPTHKNHPCTKWVGESESNWKWMIEYTAALCEEYTLRFGKRHKSQSVLEIIEKLPLTFTLKAKTKNCLVMPMEFRTDEVVLSYRKFYASKANLRYRRSEPPFWLGNYRAK